VVLVDCAPRPGDRLFRGFYVPEYPGITLNRVDLYLSARVAGTYTVSLHARADSFNGALIDTTWATVTLSDDDQDIVFTSFHFPSSSTIAGLPITFALFLVSGPDDMVFYAVSTCDSDPDCVPEGPHCPAIETNDTSPPLSTFRRNGIGGRIVGVISILRP
jgi:hypothetical protein